MQTQASPTCMPHGFCKCHVNTYWLTVRDRDRPATLYVVAGHHTTTATIPSSANLLNH